MTESQPYHRHLSSEFEKDLEDLRAKLLRMASHVEGLIADALTALTERDSGRAEAVVERDREIDHLEKEVDELCLRIFALRQPAASDLRRITTAFKVVTDLERMGDLSVNIAKAALQINRLPRERLAVDLSPMGDAVRNMVRRSLDAFVDEDVALARQVVVSDVLVDKLHDQAFAELVRAMVESPAVIETGTCLLLIARHLERIGDHATNVAEQVIFMVQGDDVRHQKAKLRAEAEGRPLG